MEYNGGSRDRDAFDPYDGEQRDGYTGNAPDRGDGSYDRQDYGQSPYSRSPYEQSPYNSGSYGDFGGDRGDFDRTGRTERRASSERGDEYGRGGDYGREDRGAYARGDEYGQDRYARGGSYERGDYDRTGRTERQGYGRGDEYDRGGEYGRGGYEREDRGAYARDDFGRTGRTERQSYGREYDDYDRDADALQTTGRRKAPRYDADNMDESPFETETPYDDEEEETRAPRKKKKRSKFSRFMRGLGAYIAQLPTQTLVLFGGIVAVVLVGIILLVILLPKTPKTAAPEDNGQLSIADITPTPSLAPTIAPPEVTPEPEATPIVDPFNGSFIKTIGEENDVIPAVQERLVELGYMEMPAEGYTKRYGTATKNGVRIFQVKNYDDSKDWDGILGLGTYTLLMSDEAKAFYLARGDGDSRTAELTQLVEAVKKLQARLVELGYLGAGSDTGVFGSGTATAVKTFQQYHGLLADGWAGQSTLALLYSDQAMTAAVGKANPITPTPEGADAAATAADPNAAATVTTDPNGAAVATTDGAVAVN